MINDIYIYMNKQNIEVNKDLYYLLVIVRVNRQVCGSQQKLSF